MTTAEFNEQYARLAAHYPRFATTDFKSTIARAVGGLRAEWFKAMTDRILLANNSFIDILQEIKDEKRSRGFDMTNNDNAKEFERIRFHGSDRVFETELKKHNAASLWDAVQKSKGKGA